MPKYGQKPSQSKDYDHYHGPLGKDVQQSIQNPEPNKDGEASKRGK